MAGPVTDFTSLTDVGRARRLRPLAMEALGRYDIEVGRLRLITNSWNCVFRVDAIDGRRFALRVTLPRPERRPEAVRSEAAFMAAVAAGTEVDVPVPVANRDGELVTPATAHGVPQARDCVLYSWVTGVDLADRATPDRYRRLGAVSASLHRFAEGWTAPEWMDLPLYDATIHTGEALVLFGERAQSHLTDEHREALPELVATLDANVAAAHARGPVIVTHGDLHHWNVLVDRDRLSVIDFEDVQWAAPVLDVSTTLYYVRWRDDYDELFAAFAEGYAGVRPWVETFEGELDTLIPARGLDLLNVVIDDPELGLDRTELSARIVGRVIALLG